MGQKLSNEIADKPDCTAELLTSDKHFKGLPGAVLFTQARPG